MAQYSKGELVKNILLTLASIGAVATFVVLPGMTAVLSLFKPRNKKERSSLGRTLHSMKINGFVNIRKQGINYSLSITSKGQRRLARYHFDNLSLKKQKRWDGLWRLVTFDIPETKRGARISLNIKLKELGFLPFQKSMFLYPYNCKEEIDFIKDYFNSHDHIKYFLVKGFEGNEKFKRHFKITES